MSNNKLSEEKKQKSDVNSASNAVYQANSSPEDPKVAPATTTVISPHEQMLAAVEQCVEEAKEHFNYSGPSDIKSLRKHLATIIADDLDDGPISTVKRLRKETDALMQQLHPVDFTVEELNKKTAYLNANSRIMCFGPDGEFTLKKRDDFMNDYANQFVEIPDHKGPNKVKRVTKSGVWWTSPLRRTYEDIVFTPTNDAAEQKVIEEKGIYNLFQDYAVQPRKKNIERSGRGGRLLWHDHVEDVICDRDRSLYEYLMNVLAYKIQKPTKKRTPAIMIIGGQGCGKDTFAYPIHKILGKHYYPGRSVSELEGRFTWHFKNKLVICISEAEWDKPWGKNQTPPAIKSWITASEITYEQKLQTPITLPNYTMLILLSNSSSPLPLEPGDRRFVVLKASSHKTGDKTYFNQLYYELDNGGVEELLEELLTRPIKDFDPMAIPITQAKRELMELNESSVDTFARTALQEGNFPDFPVKERPWNAKRWDETESEYRVVKNELWLAYLAFCSEKQLVAVRSDIEFGRQFSQVFRSMKTGRMPTEENQRPTCYIIRDIETCRREHCKDRGLVYEKEFGDDNRD